MFIGLFSVHFSLIFFCFGFIKMPTNACTIWQLLTSPGSAHGSPPSPVAHTYVLLLNTNCSSPARLHRRLVHGHFPHRARCPGMPFPRSSVIQPSPSASSDNPWKLTYLLTYLSTHSDAFSCFKHKRKLVITKFRTFHCNFLSESRVPISPDTICWWRRMTRMFSRSV